MSARLSVYLLALLLCAARPASAESPALGVESRYGFDSGVGLGLRGAAPFRVYDRDIEAHVTLVRFFSDLGSHSDFGLGLALPVVRVRSARLYVAGGVARARIAVVTFDRVGTTTWDQLGRVSRSRLETGLQASAGLRVGRHLLIDARVATRGLERTTLAVAALF